MPNGPFPRVAARQPVRPNHVNRLAEALENTPTFAESPGALTDANINANATTINAAIGRLNNREYDVRLWGTPTGTATDVTFINQAIVDIQGYGGGTLVFPNVATGYGVTRVADQQLSGIMPKPRVSMHSHGATFYMRGNCHFVWADSVSEQYEIITADVAAGSFTLTVANGAVFTVGKPIMVRLNTNPEDLPEPQTIVFAKITGIAGNVLTLDAPMPAAMSVAGTTETWNRSVRQFTELIENVSYSGTWNLVNLMGPNENAEAGMSLKHCRNITIGTVIGTDTGSAVAGMQFCDHIHVDTLRSISAIAQGGHSAKGRLFGCSNTSHLHINHLIAEKVKQTVFFIESYCRDVTIDHLYHMNDDPGRNALEVYGIHASSNSRVHVNYARFLGLPHQTISGSGGITIGTLDLQLSSQPSGLGAVMSYVQDQVNINQLTYGPRQRVSKVVRIPTGYLDVPIGGLGVVAGAWIEVSTTTGLYDIYWKAATGSASGPAGAQAGVISLTAGTAYRVPTSSAWGGAFGQNDPTQTHRMEFSSDTMAADAWAAITLDYFPLTTAVGEMHSMEPDATTRKFLQAPVAANPNTSGATLAALETEVNELKATLRTLGLLTP